MFAPHFFAAIFTEGEAITTVPVFNLEQWGIVLPVFVISLLIGLIDEILRLIIGVYCKLVMISNILCGGNSDCVKRHCAESFTYLESEFCT